MRDYSGKKPYQYFPRRDSVISSDTFRSEYHIFRHPAGSSSSSSFERGGGLYSSLRNSLKPFKLTTHSAMDLMSTDGGPPTGGAASNFLRELRPSIRRRANSASAFVNNTT